MKKLNFAYLFAMLFFSAIMLTSCGTKKSLNDRPDISSYSLNETPRQTINDSLFFKDKSSLRKNEYGQWELVAFGNNPYDLGNSIGVLTQELMVKQEDLFYEKVKTMVP